MGAIEEGAPMSWRIGVVHTTRYDYAREVRSSYNEARITPLTTLDQLVLEATVTVTPSVEVFRYLDYWSSVVHAFNIDVPHSEMAVVGRSVVDTSTDGVGGSGASWSEVIDPLVADDWAELLAPTPIVAADDALHAVAEELRAGAASPTDAGAAAVGWVRDQLDYVTGTTGVHTSAIEAWHGGRGVCQDFAHLTLALARAMGIPARYCSGYLHPHPEAGIGQAVVGQSHAWVELWTGEWRGVDPTSGEDAGERHVLVARGRDYGDVTPIKGVLNGGLTAALEVGVELTRLA